MDLGLKGKKALVSGSTRGIGRRITEALLAEGCAVAIGSRKQADVDKALGELSSKGTVVGSELDVANADSYKAWIAKSAEQLGGIDIFVHNVSGGGGMEGEKSWYNVFETDVMGAVRGVEAATPFLKESGVGSVIFIGTTAAVETFMAPMAYNALKAGLVTYAKQLSQALGKHPCQRRLPRADLLRRRSVGKYREARARHVQGAPRDPAQRPFRHP